MAETFVRGMFRVYRATTQIHLGAISKDILKDATFEYDGTTMRLGADTYDMPIIQKGIEQGWFVPAEDTTTEYVSKPAGVQVRPATSAGEKRGEPMQVEPASHEETVVNTMDNHAVRMAQAQTRQPAPAPQPATVDDAKAARIAALQAELAALQAKPDPVLEQAFTPEPPPPAPDLTDAVASVPFIPQVTPGRPLTVEEADAINQAILDRERTKPVPPKAQRAPEALGTTQGGFQVVQAEAQEGVAVGNYRFKTAAGTEGAARNQAPVDITKVSAAAVEAQVGPVAVTPKREIQIPTSTTQIPAEGNVDIRTKLEGGATGDVAKAAGGEHLTELLGETAAAAGPDMTNPLKWDMNNQWRQRVKLAVDQYGQNPDALRQILAIETPAVRKHIGIALKKLHGA